MTTSHGATLDLFFSVASPITLANLIVDIERTDEPDRDTVDLQTRARDELVAIVGEVQARKLFFDAL